MASFVIPSNASDSIPAWDARVGENLKAAAKGENQDKVKLKKACQEMESVFLNMMLKAMRDTVQKSPFSGHSSQEETMQSMFDMEMTKNLANAGGTGLADMMYRTLSDTGVKHPNAYTQPVALKKEVSIKL